MTGKDYGRSLVNTPVHLIVYRFPLQGIRVLFIASKFLLQHLLPTVSKTSHEY